MAGSRNLAYGEQADPDHSEGSAGRESIGGETGTLVGCIGGRRTSDDAPELGAMVKHELDLRTQSPWLGWRNWRS